MNFNKCTLSSTAGELIFGALHCNTELQVISILNIFINESSANISITKKYQSGVDWTWWIPSPKSDCSNISSY